MSPAQAEAALQNGIETVDECCLPDSSPAIVGLGEMGIGNTTSAAAIVCAITGLDAHKAAGRGTGIDDAALAVKAEVIEKALDLHSPRGDDALDILHKIGGYEIAGMTGAALAAASRGMMVMLDGLISTAAGCCAVLLEPRIREYLFVGHASVEPAQQSACEFTGQRPLLDLQMRLGEGTGAVLAMDVVDAGCAVMRDMASFSDAGVSRESGH
jgi:nicotinate-nucleotide--dimethylbenzimidazole phosphoribosyltransferase